MIEGKGEGKFSNDESDARTRALQLLGGHPRRTPGRLNESTPAEDVKGNFAKYARHPKKNNEKVCLGFGCMWAGSFEARGQKDQKKESNLNRSSYHALSKITICTNFIKK